MVWTGHFRSWITRAPSWISPDARSGHPFSHPEVWLRYLNREVAAAIGRLEEELGVAGSGEGGKPGEPDLAQSRQAGEDCPPHAPRVTTFWWGVAAWARSSCADITSWLKEEDGWALHHELTETFCRPNREFARWPRAA